MSVRTIHPRLPVALDRTSPVPLYHQIAEQVRSAIEAGTLRPGDSIEREDHLAQMLKISRPTLRRALSILVEQGLISRSRGSGTIVSAPIAGDLKSAGAPRVTHRKRPAIRILRLDPDCQDADVAEALGLEEACRLIYLERLIVVGGDCVAVQRTWIPATMLDPLEADLATAPIRAVLRDTGRAIATEQRTHTSRAGTPRERAALGGGHVGEIHEVRSLGYDADGICVELTISTHLQESEALLEAS